MTQAQATANLLDERNVGSSPEIDQEFAGVELRRAPLVTARTGRPRVLYIDHEANALSAVAPVLREAFEVWVARNFEQGLEIGSEVAYAADLIIVDIDSDTIFRADSFIAEYRRRAKREAPVIFVGSVRPTLDITRSIRRATFLPKPIDARELSRRGNDLLSGQRRVGDTTD